MSEKRYVVEKVFEYKGLTCVVAMMSLGHRCGYVGVPKEHKYYGANYVDVNHIDCHGGLTYSSPHENCNYPVKEHSDLWWFGWDYAHYGDGYDMASIVENFGVEKVEDIKKYNILMGYPYSLHEVEEDCIFVAEQFLD